MPTKHIRLYRLNKILTCITENRKHEDRTFRILLKMLSDEIGESFNKHEEYYAELCDIYSHAVSADWLRTDMNPREVKAAAEKHHEIICDRFRAAIEQEIAFFSGTSVITAMAV